MVRFNQVDDDWSGAGFSDVGVTRVQRAGSDVGEAPRHEIAGRKVAGGEAGAMGI